MTCRFFRAFSTRPGNLSIPSTSADFVATQGPLFDALPARIGTYACQRKQPDTRFSESTELEKKIKANLEGLGL